jgi:hypothetical protein
MPKKMLVTERILMKEIFCFDKENANERENAVDGYHANEREP